MEPNDHTASHSGEPQGEAQEPAALHSPEPIEPAPQPEQQDAATEPQTGPASERVIVSRVRELVSLRRWIKASQVVIAAVTVANLVVAYYQLRALNETNQQTKDVIELTRDALGATKAANEIAKDGLIETRRSNEAAERMALAAEGQTAFAKEGLADSRRVADRAIEAFKADQRARLSFDIQFSPISVSEGGKPLGEFVINLTNSGRTNATNVRYAGEVFFDSASFWGDPTRAMFTGESNWHRLGTILPNEQTRTARVRGVGYLPGSEEWFAMAIVAVEVRYCDVFGRPHWVFRCIRQRTVDGANSYGPTIDCGSTADAEGDPYDERECKR